MLRRTPLAALGALTLVLVATGCGDDDGGLGASAVEELIEEGLGDDVDIDLDGDGGFSVAVDVDGDGEPDSIDIDVGEDGDISIDGDLDGDGEVDSVEFDSDGEGGGELTFDDIDGESGSIEIDADGDDGSVSIEGGDGDESIEFDSTTELPDDWPTDIPRPDGLAIENATSIGGSGSLQLFIAGRVDELAWADAYGSALEAAGYDEVFRTEAGGAITATYGDSSSDQPVVNVSVADDADGGFYATVTVVSE